MTETAIPRQSQVRWAGFVPRQASTVRVAAHEDIPVLTDLLVDAFADDALTRWMLPDPAERRAALPAFFRVFLELSLDHGGVLTTPDRDAALLYLSPEGRVAAQERDDEVQARLAAAVGPAAWPLLLTIIGMQTAHHPHGDGYYYLPFAAARPGRQRRGAVSTLLDTLMERADHERMGAYAEASSPGGLAVTLGHGFTPLGTEIALPDGPTLRPLWREPR